VGKTGNSWMAIHLARLIPRMLRVKPWSARTGGVGGGRLCFFLLLPLRFFLLFVFFLVI